MEYHSEPGVSESEEGSTTSEEDTFLSIQYQSSPHFPKPYLHNQDFKKVSDQGLKYITKYFNPESIYTSLQLFPDLSRDFIHSNTFGDSTQFTLLQHYMNKFIHAFLQRWLELQARYSKSDINCFIIPCIL